MVRAIKQESRGTVASLLPSLSTVQALRVRPAAGVSNAANNPRIARARSQSMKSGRAESEYVWTTESRCAVRYCRNRVMVLAQGVEP